MLHIFLVILKIIGILLAVIAGILLLLVLCALYCPLRYRMEGQYKDRWKIRAVLRFLGPAVWLTVWYEEDVHYRLRILGIPVWSSEKHMTEEKNKTKDKQAGKNRQKNTDLEKEEATEARLPTVQKETRNATEEKDVQKNTAQSAHKDKKKTKGSGQIFGRITMIYQRFAETLKNLWSLFLNLKEVWEDDQARRGITTIKKELWFFLGRIKPRNIRWYLKIGMEDPADTGQLLGILAVFGSFWGERFIVEPDFEQKVLETDFWAKGMIQGFRLVRLARKGWFDQDIRYLLEKGKGLRRK